MKFTDATDGIYVWDGKAKLGMDGIGLNGDLWEQDYVYLRIVHDQDK